MRKKWFRRSLNDKEISYFGRLGERLGNACRLDKAVQYSNVYIRKHRRIALPLIVVGTIGLFAVGFWLDTRKGWCTPNIPDELILPRDTFQGYDRLIIEQQNELKELIDSVQYLIDRGNLSAEDSLYIVWGITYLNNIEEQHK